MKTGFDTIGNATVIAYDQGKPILTTDPWIQGSAYFGSWNLSHAVPPEQKQAAIKSEFIWFSHGHPDHLNGDSLKEFKGKTILLPDHVNGRIAKDLTAMGYKVQILEDRKWTSLSSNVRILCIADYYQDAILLIDVNGRLIVNTNDAIDRGWGGFVRKIIKNYKVSVLLSLFGYGDADMIHFYDQNNQFIEPKAAQRKAVGAYIADVTKSYGVSYVIPFSSMHHYQRTDSVWANKYTTPLDAYAEGFQSSRCQLLPAFIRFNCEDDTWHEIKPPSNQALILDPKEFGDNWSDMLDAKEAEALQRYFTKIEHLHTFLDFICVRVGGKEHHIPLAKTKKDRGLIFDVPRHSLNIAVKYEIFDDLLIGNFMKTTLHGKWSNSKLYPDFTPYVARYADNAYVTTQEQLDKYMKEYQKRQPVEFFLHSLEQKSIDVFRKGVSDKSPLFGAGKKAYWFIKGALK